jgi:hypothetical protein
MRRVHYCAASGAVATAAAIVTSWGFAGTARVIVWCVVVAVVAIGAGLFADPVMEALARSRPDDDRG